MNFLFAKKWSSDFSKCSNIYKIKKKLYSNSLSFPLILHGMGTILPSVWEITPLKNRQKRNLRIKSGMCNWSLHQNCTGNGVIKSAFQPSSMSHTRFSQNTCTLIKIQYY